MVHCVIVRARALPRAQSIVKIARSGLDDWEENEKDTLGSDECSRNMLSAPEDVVVAASLPPPPPRRGEDTVRRRNRFLHPAVAVDTEAGDDQAECRWQKKGESEVTRAREPEHERQRVRADRCWWGG